MGTGGKRSLEQILRKRREKGIERRNETDKEIGIKKGREKGIGEDLIGKNLGTEMKDIDVTVEENEKEKEGITIERNVTEIVRMKIAETGKGTEDDKLSWEVLI